VFRIAVNLVISALRRRKQGSVLSLDHASGDDCGETGCRAGVQIAGGDRPPDEEASRREEQALVRRALEDLEEQQRAIVVLRDLESLDYAEIAEILNVPVGTVKSRLHRARLALAELLGPVLEETRSRTAPE
jgi:RNA polymerase sigma-70 factor (ECF subfamily)